MSRPCNICHSDARRAIDVALVEGVSYRRVAAQFNVQPGAVSRHARQHLRRALAAVAAVATIADASIDTSDVAEGTEGVAATADSATVDLPALLPPGDIAPGLLTLFRQRRFAELTASSSLIQLALRDLARLEALSEAAALANDGAAIMALTKVRWTILERIGVFHDKPDQPLDSSRSNGRNAADTLIEMCKNFMSGNYGDNEEADRPEIPGNLETDSEDRPPGPASSDRFD